MAWLGVFGVSAFTVAIAVLVVTFGEIPEAEASEPFIGTIQYFGFNFAPRGWGLCQGQLLPISQNTALFSLLGTTYGGDGRTTFGLPDDRGRVLIGMGTGPGLSAYTIGSRGGTETISTSQTRPDWAWRSRRTRVWLSVSSGLTSRSLFRWPRG